jgi:16S rRNA (guanine527-N7)-methyltransferase
MTGGAVAPALTEGQFRLLRSYEALLREHSAALGLISPGDIADLWDRHIMDSLRALACLEEGDRSLADVGSGAGLPGIPVAIARPRCSVALIEPRARRVAFLELAAERLRLPNVRVVVGRAQDVTLGADVAFARALANPARAWALARPCVRPGGRVAYFGGRSWRAGEERAMSVAGVRVSVCSPASEEWQGPVVMMAAVDDPAVPPDD